MQDENDMSITSKVSSSENIQFYDRLLSLSDVLSIVNLGKTKLYEMIENGEFPKYLKIGKCSRWSQNEVYRWVNCKISNRGSR